MKLLMACVVVTGCAQAAPPNAIIGGLVDGGRGTDGDGGRDNGGTFDPDAAVIDAPPQVVTLSQTSTNMVIADNSIGCGSGGITRNNSYYRVFTPADSGVTGALHITQVDFGIEYAHSTTGSQPATLKIGTYTGTVTPATETLSSTGTNLTSAPITIKDAAAPTAMSAPITADIPAGSSFIVELAVPAGQTFYVGSNAGSETKPGFTSASDCSLTVPTSFASLDLGTITMVMSVTGTQSSR